MDIKLLIKRKSSFWHKYDDDFEIVLTVFEGQFSAMCSCEFMEMIEDDSTLIFN